MEREVHLTIFLLLISNLIFAQLPQNEYHYDIQLYSASHIYHLSDNYKEVNQDKSKKDTLISAAFMDYKGWDSLVITKPYRSIEAARFYIINDDGERLIFKSADFIFIRNDSVTIEKIIGEQFSNSIIQIFNKIEKGDKMIFREIRYTTLNGSTLSFSPLSIYVI